MTRFRNTVFLIPVLLLLAYGAVLGWFSVREDAFIYFPRKGPRDASAFGMNIEEVHLTTRDGVHLVAWAVPADSGIASGIWLLYFHGNGGNISSRGYVEHFREFQRMGVNTLAVDYRGYGDSEGTPDEQGLYADASAAYHYLVEIRRVPPGRIVVFGYSLGSAVATDLAARVASAGVILEGAFTSLPDVGQRQYPFLPVRWMMKNRFDSVHKIENVAEPKLFLHARQDEVIPIEEGKALFHAAGEPKLFVETAGGHNTASTADSAKFYGAIASFLRQLFPAMSRTELHEWNY